MCDAAVTAEAALAAGLLHGSGFGNEGALLGGATVIGAVLRPFENAMTALLAVPVAIASILLLQPQLPHVRSAATVHSDALALHFRTALIIGITLLLSNRFHRKFRFIAGSFVCFALPFALSLPLIVGFACLLANAVFAGLRRLGPSLVYADAAIVSQCIALIALHTMSLAGPLHILGLHAWHSGGVSAALCVVFCAATLLIITLWTSSLMIRNRRGTALLVLCAITLLLTDRWYAILDTSDTDGGLVKWTLFELLFVNSPTRLLLCLFWVFLLGISTTIVAFALAETDHHESESSPPETSHKQRLGKGWRKFWHALAIAMFVPAIALDVELFRLATGMVVAATTVLEAFRLFWPKSTLLSSIGGFYARFASDQDCGEVIVTHIFLLTGLSSAAWIGPTSATPLHWIAPYSGIISVGVGDAAASLFGCLLGRHRWPGTKKTIEGTLASVICSLAFASLLWFSHCAPVNARFPLCDPPVVCAVLVASLAEAFAGRAVDNLTLPMHFHTVLCLLSKFS